MVLIAGTLVVAGVFIVHLRERVGTPHPTS